MTTTAMISSVIQQLIDLSMQPEVNLIPYSADEIQNFINTFRSMHALMKDAEDGQFETLSMRLMFERLSYAACIMDDFLDEWITENRINSQLSELKMAVTTNSNKGIKKKVFSFLASLYCFSSSSMRVILSHDNNNIGSRIRQIHQWLYPVSYKLDILTTVFLRNNVENQEALKSTSLVDISDDVYGRVIDKDIIIDILEDVYGRVIDKDIIMSRLLSDSSSSKRKTRSVLSHPIIVPIVGMGGIGKTTLAQLVFNDEKVKKHFEMTMWVCASENFDLSRMALDIINHDGHRPYSYESIGLNRFVSQSVKQKRYLIVLDDVRTEDPVEWKVLMDALNSGAQGSRILVTTRNEGVANMMNTIYTHYLGNLSDDDCWSLLRRIAFVGREAEEQEDLNEIGFRLAMKCKGLPLAAKTLGGVLCFKRTKRDWVAVLNNEIWELEEVDHFLIPALLLSYYDLPSPLKGCFAYCSIFPKGHEMNKDVLIKLWMAQGLINSTGGREELEMIGDECFNNLSSRSFFQDLSKDENRNIISCKIPDLLYDLGKHIATDKSCITQYDGDILNPDKFRIRHLSLIIEDRVDSRRYVHHSLYMPMFHSILLNLMTEVESPLRDFPASGFSWGLKWLRVLCFNSIGFESLSNKIGELIHLRYLDLSGNSKLRELPESMANLYNLQTLELKGCQGLCKLPKEMHRMINLRHLNIENTPSLSYLPEGFGKLSSLRTLSRFIVSEASKGCTIEELKDLNHLEGKIQIEGLYRVKTIEEASKAELKNKNLWGLTLDFKGKDEETDTDLETLIADRMEGILAGLQPHPNSKKLEIQFYLGSKFPRWIEESPKLSHLNSLVLQDCINCTELPALGQLPSLETLIIHRLQNLKHICLKFYSSAGSNNTIFPKLKHLEICDMRSLETWDLGYGKQVGEIMPCIRYLRLGCQKLQAFPTLWRLASLETLKIETAGDVKHTGSGFYCNAGRSVHSIAFPMLKHLEICDLKSLEVWDLGDGEDVGKIMPCLSYLKLGCNRLKAFPALWKLPSLETLEIGTTGNLKHIGVEFHGNYGTCADRVAFSKLKELHISDMNLEVWDLGDGLVRKIMPCLRHVELDCPKIKVLPALGELQSLEILGITAEEIKQIGSEFYRNGCGEHATRVAFPNLKELYFRSMSSLEVWDLGEGQLMPCLRQLKLNCENLKAWPALERLPSLEVLDIVLDEEETHIGCDFYGLSTGERFHSWYEKIGGMGLWRIRRRRNH